MGVPVPSFTQMSRRRRALATLVVSLKFVVPSLMPRFPFVGAWGNYVLDSVDGDVLLELGLPDETYQTIDKAADYFSYVIMLIVGIRWRIKRLVVLLFVHRTIGQALFFTTRNELAFVSFPNFLEPLVLVYTLLLARHQGREAQAYAGYRRHRAPIWSAIIAYKLWNEWMLHVANADLSQRVLGFTGGARERGQPIVRYDLGDSVTLEPVAGANRGSVAMAVQRQIEGLLARQGLANVVVAMSDDLPQPERSGKFRQGFRQTTP